MRGNAMDNQTPEQQEYEAEATRLALIPLEDQKTFVAMLRAVARDPNVSDDDRTEARHRSDALAKLLNHRK